MLQRPSETLPPVSSAVAQGFLRVPGGHVARWDHAKSSWQIVSTALYDLEQAEDHARGLVESIQQCEGMLRNQRQTLERCRANLSAAQGRLRAVGKDRDARERAQREMAEAGRLVANAESGELSINETLDDQRRMLAEVQSMIADVRGDLARAAVKPGAKAMEVR